MSHRITPEFVNSLGPDEIFVFGCRNSGRHFDGASAFALKHFGAVMGQREGRQGKSYAIPTIGGTIGWYDIRKSVKKFTEYAAIHPELHFLVTPIGCGGGGWSPRRIAPLFAKASKLENVSLPKEFWENLDKNLIIKYKERFEKHRKIWIKRAKHQLEKRIVGLLGILHPAILYRILSFVCIQKYLYYEEYPAGEGMATVLPKITVIPNYAEYIVNHNIKRTFVLRDYKGRFKFKDSDIDWSSTESLSQKIIKIIKSRETPYSISGILYPGYKDGLACVLWTVSPNGKKYYLDKWDNGYQTDEKEIKLYGLIDTLGRVIVKMQVIPIDYSKDHILCVLRKQVTSLK